MLEVRNLSIRLPSGQCLVEDLSFSVNAGEVLALLGPSGSGKSTLLDWLTGTLDPAISSTGRLLLQGEDITHRPTHLRALGLVMQEGGLFPHLSVGENLQFAARTRLTDGALDSVLAKADLRGMADRDPATLSGGQKARVSLLRTLVNQPRAVFLDEPFSKLDAELRDQIRQFTWQQTGDVPVVLVTHDAQDIPPGGQSVHLGAAVC